MDKEAFKSVFDSVQADKTHHKLVSFSVHGQIAQHLVDGMTFNAKPLPHEYLDEPKAFFDWVDNDWLNGNQIKDIPYRERLKYQYQLTFGKNADIYRYNLAIPAMGSKSSDYGMDVDYPYIPLSIHAELNDFLSNNSRTFIFRVNETPVYKDGSWVEIEQF